MVYGVVLFEVGDLGTNTFGGIVGRKVVWEGKKNNQIGSDIRCIIRIRMFIFVFVLSMLALKVWLM